MLVRPSARICPLALAFWKETDSSSSSTTSTPASVSAPYICTIVKPSQPLSLRTVRQINGDTEMTREEGVGGVGYL